MIDGEPAGFLLDTNIFNRVLDGVDDASPEALRVRGPLFVTHIQWDEIGNTRDETRRRRYRMYSA